MNETNQDIDTKIRDLHRKTPFFHWGKLRFIGSIRVLSVISFIGAILAAGLSLPQLKQINASDLLSDSYIVWSFIFFIISLLLVNLIYYIFCPSIIKKFLSLSDFYMHQINIKKCQQETYPDDPFDASLEHVSKQYISDLSTGKYARLALKSFFTISLIFLIMFVYNVYKVTISPQDSLQSKNIIVNFNFNSSELTPVGKSKLTKISKEILNSNAIVIIKGYTDKIGSIVYNQKLSLERANAVKNYLIYFEKIKESKITIVGYGSLWPSASNSLEKDRKQNRRAEIEIVPIAICK